MNEYNFKMGCLDIVLAAAKGKMRSGHETAISVLGGYNRTRVFKAENLINMSIGEFCRFVMNIHLEHKDREGFRAVMRKLELFIIIVSETHGAQINEEHKHHKNKKKKAL